LWGGGELPTGKTTYGHDAEIDVVPEHGDVVLPEVHDFVYFFHREINDEPDGGQHADQREQRVGHSVPVQLDGPKRGRRDDAARSRKFEHQSADTERKVGINSTTIERHLVLIIRI